MDLPGWMVPYKFVKIYRAAAPSEEAFALLDEARTVRPDARLVYCRVDDDPTAAGFAAVCDDWCGQRVLFPSAKLAEAIDAWDPF